MYEGRGRAMYTYVILHIVYMLCNVRVEAIHQKPH